jgi:hypothetical protein
VRGSLTEFHRRRKVRESEFDKPAVVGYQGTYGSRAVEPRTGPYTALGERYPAARGFFPAAAFSRRHCRSFPDQP